VATELTAVPVRAPGPLPAAPTLAGWFAASGRPLAATAIEEEGPAEILVVRDRSALPALEEIVQQTNRPGSLLPAAFRLRSTMPLDPGTVVRFVESTAKAYPGERSTSLLFGSTRELDGKGGGFLSLLSRTLPDPGTSPPRLADAVAVAGLDALAGNRRRAVILVLPSAAADASQHDAAMVRRYLESIRVPLHVWSLAPPPYSAEAAVWGEVEDASSLYRMQLAYDRLRRDLAAQRIVWLEGRHLPQSIALTPAAPQDVELVSGPGR